MAENNSEKGNTPVNENGEFIVAIDRAYSLRLSGDKEQALRLAASILVAGSYDLGAACLVSRLLLDEGRPKVVAQVAARLVDGYLRRGNLPAACVTARLGMDAGLDGSALLRSIAEAFGKGSARVGDVAPMPPPLPATGEIAPFFAKLSADGLLDAAEKALKRFSEQKDPAPADSKIPKLPLYGELEPPMLYKLLSIQQLREFAVGEEVIKQGDEGSEAFVVAWGVLKAVRKDKAGETVLAALGPGAIFGEMSLVSQTPRAASVVAAEPCALLVMSRDNLEDLASQQPIIAQQLASFCHGRMVSNLIRHSAFLSAVHPDKRHELISRFQARAFENGEILVRQGEQSSGLFLIASGAVQVCSADSDGDLVVLAELGPGEVVGEISLVLRRPATADVVAVHPTVALELTRERFQETVREYPRLIGELYELATKREEETSSVVAQQALDALDMVII